MTDESDTRQSDTENADQIIYWNDVAGAKWVANQVSLDAVFSPLTQALMEGAAPQAGDHVLDVGCGCGETSLIAAARVGATGRVLSVDISRPMLHHAARRRAAADQAGLAPIVWLHADAMTHAFAAETADLMISRFGVMFFANPKMAFVNIRKALKPGARFAFISWRPRSQVEWMAWPLDQVASVLATPPETMGEPGPFGFADEKATRLMLLDAGFADVTVTPVDAPLAIGTGTHAVEDAMTLLLDTGPVAALFRDADPAVRPAAEAILHHALKGRATSDGVRLAGACWLYKGVA